MLKFYTLLIVYSLFFSSATSNTEGILNHLKRFTATPHPMGSEAQKKYSNELNVYFKNNGWNSIVQTFEAKKLSEKNSKKISGHNLGDEFISGYNVVATLPKIKNSSCSLLLGGHFDTKNFESFKFFGANDGGSSTALLQELSKNIALIRNSKEKISKIKPNSWIFCALTIVLFDGEEAQLLEWDTGTREHGLQDNLYGSRSFVKGLNPRNSPNLAFIFDMVGHKNQTLFLTNESHEKYRNQVLSTNKKNGKVNLIFAPLGIQDDHTPFLEKKIPIIHMIDWTNLKEWHTPNDNIDIVSPEKINNLMELILSWMTNYSP
jgi:glutaminyl-peptide cyclotransferase